MEERSSQNLAHDTQLFHDVFDASPVGIVVENLEGRPLFANAAFCSFLGFSEEELHNKHCVDFSPREDAEKDWTLFQQLRAGSIDHYQMEKRYFRRDGSLVWGSLRMSLLKHTPPLIVAMVEEITDKKNAEEARSRHAAIVESSEDAIASTTLDGVIVSWNAGAQRLFGYAEKEVIGKSVATLVPPELPEEEENKILGTLKAGGHINQFETVRATKMGKRIDVSLSISPIKDATGKTVGFSGITRDITERKRAQMALRESEERLRLAVQAGKMFAYSWDAATDAIERTGDSAQILGIKKEEAVTGAAVSAIVHPDDKQRLEAALAKLSIGSPILQIAYRIIRPDGAVTWLERNSRAYFDAQGKLKRIVGMIVDVTEHKRAEELQRETNRVLENQSAELQAREQLLKIFVKNVPAGVAMLDHDMRYLQVSDRWCADYSLDSSQVLGRSHYELFPDIPEHWKDAHRRALGGETLRADEDLWDREDGTSTWVRWELRPWQNADGAIGGILIFAEDITHRKQMEEALSGMSRKLIAAQEQERARISRELHDDINQRLALLAVELDRWDQSASHKPDFHNNLEQAKQRIFEISSDVQTLSHQLHSSKLEYLGLATAAKSLCREIAEKNNVRIAFKQSGVPRSLSNEVSLSLFRILQESLHNSVEHSGVKHIEVQLWEHSNEIHLTVKDSGRGFDIEAAKQGRGIGLTSMQERARLVNGTITIESKPMRGTTIQVSIPVAEQEAQRAVG